MWLFSRDTRKANTDRDPVTPDKRFACYTEQEVCRALGKKILLNQSVGLGVFDSELFDFHYSQYSHVSTHHFL